MDRRDFLKIAAVAGVVTSLGSKRSYGADSFPHRVLGHTVRKSR